MEITIYLDDYSKEFRHQLLVQLNDPLVLSQLALGSNSADWYSITLNPNTLPSTLDTLARYNNYSVCLSIAHHKSTSPETLEYLYGQFGNEWQLLCAIAEHSNTPKYLLKELSNHNHYEVLRAVARNPHTPVRELNKLSKNKHWEVRIAVAQNKNASEFTLMRLSRDTDHRIKKIAQNWLKP